MQYHGAMPGRSAIAVTIALGLALLAAPADGHERKLDKLGCHYAAEPTGYHCHAGVLAGQHYPTKWDAMARLENDRHAPRWSWPDFLSRLWRRLISRDIDKDPWY